MTAAARPALPRCLPGDQLPRLVFAKPGGGGFDPYYQLEAGRPMAVWLAGPKPTADELTRAAGMAPRFEAVDSRLYVLAAGGPAPRKSMGAPAYGDPDRVIADCLSPEGPAIALFTAGWRLARLLPPDALDEALAWVTAVHDATRDEPGAPSAPIIVVPDVLEPELRQRCIAFWEGRDKIKDEVADAGYSDNHSVRRTFKRRGDVLVDDPELFELLKERVSRRVLPEIAKCFQGRVTNMEGLRVGCYDSADRGEFVRHRDNTTPFTAHRQFACSIVLNTGEFEGGWVRFPEFGRTLYQAPAGGAVVFSVSLLHEVLPVTQGRRFVLLTFLFDQVGAQIEQRMLAQQRGKGVRP